MGKGLLDDEEEQQPDFDININTAYAKRFEVRAGARACSGCCRSTPSRLHAWTMACPERLLHAFARESCPLRAVCAEACCCTCRLFVCTIRHTHQRTNNLLLHMQVVCVHN